MGTTMFFDKELRDLADKSPSINLEIGRTTFRDGETHVYLVIDDRTMILDHETARELFDSVESLANYLGF